MHSSVASVCRKHSLHTPGTAPVLARRPCLHTHCPPSLNNLHYVPCRTYFIRKYVPNYCPFLLTCFVFYVYVQFAVVMSVLYDKTKRNMKNEKKRDKKQTNMHYLPVLALDISLNAFLSALICSRTRESIRFAFTNDDACSYGWV